MTALSLFNPVDMSAVRSPGAFNIPLTPATLRLGTQSSPDFQSLLNANANQNDDRSLRDSASKLVSSAFLLPLLQEVRDSTMAVGPFAPGIAEKRFGPMLDQRIADAVASSPNFPLVNAIVNRYKHHVTNAQHTSQAQGGQKDVLAH
ncbi:MAG TPA: hypothetical protein VG711_11705 [Phycisphaerales bacterium]|nr:hypothetical protein [Phycisphaerales bacterium]